VFAGTPAVALPSLDALLDSTHEVVAVVTRPDAPSGRGKKLQPSPVAQRAAELGIETLKPVRPREADFVSRLTELAPECCPVVAFGALLPQAVLDIPTHGWVNLHFSLLPAWRGAAPVQHAVLAGDPVTGATTFQLVAAMDAGPVYATVSETIADTDTAGDLLTRLSISGSELLLATMNGISADLLTAVPQSDVGVTLAPKLTVEDARIDWKLSATRLDRLIRGCSPAPGAWSTFQGERLKINAARPVDEVLPPGVLAATKRTVRVGTGTQALELGEVQAAGKKPIRAADWARGVTFVEAEVLGP
jgi:methionyl-tRNA formyltransferase